jgi:hypothetical protein
MQPRHIASFVSDRKPLNFWSFEVHIKQKNSARSTARLATRYYNLRLSSKSVFLSPGSQLQSGKISQQDASACAMLADGSHPITTRPSTRLSYVIYISFSVQYLIHRLPLIFIVLQSLDSTLNGKMKEVIVHVSSEVTTEIHEIPISVPGPDEVVIKVIVAGSNPKGLFPLSFSLATMLIFCRLAASEGLQDFAQQWR